MHSRTAAALLAACLPVASEAGDVRWRLDGVVFDEGGRATGELVFDVERGTPSDWALNVTGGSGAIPPFLYAPATSGVAALDASYIRFTDNAMGRSLQLLTEAPLAGGAAVLPLSGSSSEVLAEARRSVVRGALRRDTGADNR